MNIWTKRLITAQIHMILADLRGREGYRSDIDMDEAIAFFERMLAETEKL